MKQNQLEVMKQVAERYYYFDQSQAEIAKELQLSKPTVSRLLKKAKSEGYIKVELAFPISYKTRMEDRLQQRYGLKEVFVYDSQTTQTTLIVEEMAKQFSSCLERLIQPQSVTGFSWGRTLFHLSKHCTGTAKKGAIITQITGGGALNSMQTNSEAIITNFANCYQSEWFQLPVPSILETKEVAQALKNDRHIKQVLSLYDRLDTVVFSVGEISKEAIIVKAGYFGEEEFLRLTEQGIVGDIAGNFIDDLGRGVDTGISERRIGITLEQVKKTPNKVCIAVGTEKQKVVKGALQGGCIDYLFVDAGLAESLLKEAENE
ncbi:DeoR family transcriptional regulator [Enterococcus florum]|uniref:DeoR family transcriptional regulator n=1 Tax=Enterococcus florum TaxID=2480627 RepID=A0A4P5PCK1_9ENTE|nr:sugar-binding domain-containing protein [Enterococcus florum]GCF93172.1 DeoR family transcriptional regulator [Enterococcus florum]